MDGEHIDLYRFIISIYPVRFSKMNDFQKTDNIYPHPLQKGMGVFYYEIMNNGEQKMNTRRKINLYVKIILMFVIMIILFIPINGLSFQIESSKITRIGEEKVFCSSLGGCNTNRSVMVRVTYSCDNNPNKLFYMDRDTLQVKDKWGEWRTDYSYIHDEIYVTRCQEKRRDEEILKKNVK